MEYSDDMVVEADASEDCSFGDISCITPDGNEEKSKDENPHAIESDEEDEDENLHETKSDQNEPRDDYEDNNLREMKSKQVASISITAQDYTYDPTSVIEVSDILGLVGKNWFIFHVSPLWNLNFDTSHLNSLTKQLNKFLTKHINTNLKSQKNYFSQIAVNIEAKEAHHECIALKIEVINKETNAQLYTGLLLKSPNYTEKYNKNNLSDMPVLMTQGNKTISIVVQNWLTDRFDCVIRPYEFALYKFLWFIAISMGDAGQLYNETVLYHYLYKNEFSKGQMDVKFYVESEFLRSTLAKLSLNQSSSEATSFHYSDLIKVQSEIEDHFKITSGINASKLKLKAFEAPKIASFNVSGKIHVRSSSLMDLMLKYIMEVEDNICII